MIETDRLTPERLVTAVADTEDKVIDRAIRPKTLKDYTGQQAVCEQMDIFIQAANGKIIFGSSGKS